MGDKEKLPIPGIPGQKNKKEDEDRKKKETAEEVESWNKACDKVFSTTRFQIDHGGAAQIDEGSRAYRRFSIPEIPVPARLQSKPPAAKESKKKVRTQEPGQADKNGSLRRNQTISGNFSDLNVHTDEDFPHYHTVSSRTWQQQQQHPHHQRKDQKKPCSDVHVVQNRSRKISTGPGMPTIRDEEMEPSDVKVTPSIIVSASPEDSETGGELDQLPNRVFPRSLHCTQTSDNFSDEDQPRFGFSPKIKFGQPDTETETEEQWEKPSKKKTNRRKNSAYHGKRLKVNDPSSSRGLGSGLSDMGSQENLEYRDLEDMTSHRLDLLAGLSIPKISRISSMSSRNISEINFAKQVTSEVLRAIEIDATPHDLFVEMDELKDNMWQEQARWIKFEENLLEGAERWGKPHIASLSFHSVINLRQVIEDQCILLLDLEANSFHAVVNRLVDEFDMETDISNEVKSELLRTLLLPHKYVDGHTSLSRLGDLNRSFRRTSIRGSLRGIAGAILNNEKKQNSSSNIMTIKESNEKNNDTLGIDVGNGLQTSHSSGDLTKTTKKDNIKSKLAPGTEGTMTLIGSMESLNEPLVALIRMSRGVEMPNLMEIQIPVRFIFVLLIPKASSSLDCHEIGRAFSTLMSNKKFQQVCYIIEEKNQLLNSINNFLNETVVLPPGDWDKENLIGMSQIMKLKQKKRLRAELLAKEKAAANESALKKEAEILGAQATPYQNSLEWSRVPFGGIINEFKQRFPLFRSDITDAFSPMCIAAIVFIFCSALSGAIAFGGLLDGKTDELIGIPETLITSSICGCLFALFSGQPIVIIGVTGPVLVYDEALYKFTKGAGVEFLPCRVWIAIWTMIIAIVVAGFQGSVVVKYFTRFTKDIFAGFVATVFIYEALLQTVGFFREHPPRSLVHYCTMPDITMVLHNLTEIEADAMDKLSSNMDNSTMKDFPVFDDEPNSALFSFMLQFCTFWIAYYLRIFRNGKALGRRIRRALGDFGLPISIITMVIVDMAFPMIHTQKLKVPDGLHVTDSDKRDWVVSPFGEDSDIPIWIPFICIVPAILLYLLLFINATICELIVMERCKKSSGLHWDIVLLCMLNVPATCFGGPWMCVAQVRAMTHLSALTVMSTNHAPGESSKIIEVKDQRVTGFCVSLLVGLSILLAPLLRLIPTAVIFGVFLYLGIASLSGIDFFDRVGLLFMPPKHHKSISYTKHVRTFKMHLFTICQCVGLGILWVVKSTPAALFFPFFIMFMVPLRLSLRFLFAPEELEWLDGPHATDTVMDDEDELDFYAQANKGG